MKTNNWLTLLYYIIALFMVSCVRYAQNTAPVLQDVLEDVSIMVNESIVVTISYVDGYDKEGDDLTLQILIGENYTLTGNTIVPTTDYIGDLYIPLRLYDGESYSNTDTMIVSVVTEVVIFPLYTSSWWEYQDSVSTEDSTRDSRLEVLDFTIDIAIDETTTKAVHLLSWSNLREHDILYMVDNALEGFYQYGVIAGNDTIIKPQLQHRYPHELNATWPFTEIQYNVTDGVLFEDEEVIMTCTDTLVYITVPAGTFRCVEYSFSYEVGTSRSVFFSSDNINLFGSRHRASTGTITEKLYFSDGVGYIKNITLNGDVVIWTKVLTDYSVEQPQS